MLIALHDNGGISRREHGRKVEKSHIRFSVRVDFKFEVGQLVVRTVIARILDVFQQSGLIDVRSAQQLDRVFMIL